MLLAAVLALCLQEDATCSWLRFLARHQREEGSWGTAPDACRCDLPKPALRVDAKGIEALIRELGRPEPDRRDDAESKLRAAGEAALPRLRKARDDPDPEIRARCEALCPAEPPRGEGGGDVELTALGLLNFLGSGYTHLSKDRYDGICFGTVVKKALQWLQARQEALGAFDPEDPVADTIAVYAVSEAYGMTGSMLIKDWAQKGVDRMAVRAPFDGRGFVWRGLALKSAELADLRFPTEAARDNLAGLLESAGSAADTGACFVAIFVEKRKDRVPDLDPGSLDPEAFYFGTLSSFHSNAPNGAQWKQWNAAMKALLIPAERRGTGCERGSWDGQGYRGRVRTTALNAQNFQLWHR
jgi:hypothetical protein